MHMCDVTLWHENIIINKAAIILLVSMQYVYMALVKVILPLSVFFLQLENTFKVSIIYAKVHAASRLS